MNQLSRSIVFLTTLLLVVFHTTSSYKIRLPNYKVTEIEPNPSDGNNEEKQLMMLEQLLNSYKHHPKQNEIHPFQPLTHENFVAGTDAVSDDKLNTSCGKLTCDHVEDYPEEQIEKIYAEKFKKKELTRGEFDPAVVMRREFMPLSSSTYRGRSGIRGYEPPKFQSLISCEQMVKKTHPKEALNEDNQPTIIVRLPKERIGPNGLECKAPKHCKDASTPQYRVWLCTTKTKWIKVLTYNKKKEDLEEQVVQITDGCSCKETNEPQDD